LLRRGEDWHWSAAGRAARVSPQQAIAELAHAAVQRAGQATSGPLVLAVNDPLEAEPRRQLFAALGEKLPTAELIDATTALAHAAQPLGRWPAAGDLAEHERDYVLHLHLGFDLWYGSVLELSPKAGGVGGIAARSTVLDPLPAIGMSLLHAIADRAIAMSYKRADPGRTWQLLWTTPWVSDVLAVLAGRADHVPGQRYGLSPHVCRAPFLYQQARVPIQQALHAQSAASVLYPGRLGQPPDQAQLQDALHTGRRRLEAFGKGRSMQALVTGGLANLPDQRGQATLGEQYARQLQPRLSSVHVQGRDLPDDLLAQGAALSAADG
jgi:hypothetical protein